ncbi:MAG: Zn-ribbon domain-containing OB-fold protein [Promethearchaeota archaeon]
MDGGDKMDKMDKLKKINKDMFENDEVSLQNYQKHLEKGIFTIIECECGFKTTLPLPTCPNCGKSLKESGHWAMMDKPAKIVSYCVTYVGPPELSDLTPYASLILDFGDGLRISALLDEDFKKKAPPDDLIGKDVRVKIIKRLYGNILGAHLI